MIYIYEICTSNVVDFVNSRESIRSRSWRIAIYVALIDNNILYIIQEGQKEQPKVTPQSASTRSPKVSIHHNNKKTTICFLKIVSKKSSYVKY